jgi:hypothetical protein
MHHAAEAAGWIPEGSPPEHPLNEAWSCIATASAKLAGTLNIHDPEDWPPEPLFAGHALHRLKTARRFLRDALLAIETGAADHLAVRAHIRHHHTSYDRLMSSGADRPDARLLVAARIEETTRRWLNP